MGNAVAETGQVIQPARTRMQLERSAAGLELRGRGSSITGTGFLILWLIGWTVGCVVLAHQVITKRELFMLVFAIPFWASWFLVAGLIAHGLFGFERLRLGRNGAEVFKGIAGWNVIQRSVPLSELRRAKVYKASYEHNEQPVFGVQIRTVGKPIVVAVGAETDEREWLVATINEELDQLGVLDVPARSEASSPQEARDILTDSSAAQRPSDSTWEMSPSVSGLEFARRGRFRLGTFAGLTFVNLFWNGIVSVFVMVLLGLAPTEDSPPSGGGWWLLFFFLIPFEVIGLVMLVMWVASLTTPWWRDTLMLDRHEIVFRFSVFGLGRTRRFPTASLGGLAVQHPTKKQSNAPLHGEGNWQVVVSDQSSREVLRIKRMTEGEANWIAAKMREIYPKTFKNPAR